jgi:polyphosphate kinase
LLRSAPGCAGFSENIRVVEASSADSSNTTASSTSTVTAIREVYIGSADWRLRNLDGRVEAVVPIQDPALRDRLVRILELALADNHLAWDLGSDGRYVRRVPGPGEPLEDLHRTLMAEATGEQPRPVGPKAPRAAPSARSVAHAIAASQGRGA